MFSGYVYDIDRFNLQKLKGQNLSLVGFQIEK